MWAPAVFGSQFVVHLALTITPQHQLVGQALVKFDFRGARMGADKATVDDVGDCTAIQGLTTDQTCFLDGGEVGGSISRLPMSFSMASSLG